MCDICALMSGCLTTVCMKHIVLALCLCLGAFWCVSFNIAWPLQCYCLEYFFCTFTSFVCNSYLESLSMMPGVLSQFHYPWCGFSICIPSSYKPTTFYKKIKKKFQKIFLYCNLYITKYNIFDIKITFIYNLFTKNLDNS